MFDIAWFDKYDLSVLCLLYFMNSLISREHLQHRLLWKVNICQSVYLKVFHNLRSKYLVNSKTFEYASLIFTEP